MKVSQLGAVMVHKSQHNCFLHPQRKPNKTNQTRKQTESSPSFIIITNGIFNLIINTVVHHHDRHHHRTEMPKPFCCGHHHWNLQSHHQHCRSSSWPSSSPYRNAKTILLWKWFLWVVLQTHFDVEMVSRIFNLIINTVVHHHHRTGMPKPFCCGKPSDVLNGFQQLYSKTIRCT